MTPPPPLEIDMQSRGSHQYTSYRSLSNKISSDQLATDLSAFQRRGGQIERLETTSVLRRIPLRNSETTDTSGHEQSQIGAMKHILEKRSIEGRHDGSEFLVEAWLREGLEAFVHRVDVDRIPIPAGHLPVCMGMTAALEMGAHLARDFIDSRHI